MFDDEDWQRLRNFTILKVWMTDKELEQGSPAIIIGILLFFIIILIMYMCS